MNAWIIGLVLRTSPLHLGKHNQALFAIRVEVVRPITRPHSDRTVRTRLTHTVPQITGKSEEEVGSTIPYLRT